MAVQLSVTVRNAKLDAIESTIGASPILRIRTLAPPANCATADAGSVLVEMTLPADWLAAAGSGTKAKSGTWSDPTADGSGTAAHFRIYDSGGTTCHLQGTVTISAGGGDLTLDSVSITAGQLVTITAFTLTEANS
jgi:hypothetical protein